MRSFSTGNNEFRMELLKDENKGVCLFVLNRPQTKNAISINFVDKLEECVNSIRQNNDIRALILKSDIPKVFCAGADLKERAKMKESEVGPKVARMRSIVTAMSELPVPVIAALDGLALGGGLEIPLACDLRIAADDATLGLVETRLAIIPGGGGTQRLPRLVGLAKAKELIFTAKILSGTEAYEIGLVEHVVKQNAAGDAAYLKSLEICREIISKGPIAIAAAKQAINYGMQSDIATGLKIEEACYSQVQG
jgi:methylglutaconyl-CoA hydratase